MCKQVVKSHDWLLSKVSCVIPKAGVSFRLTVTNHECEPRGFVHVTLHHAFDIFATNLGTSLRGIKRCAKTLNLLRAPGTVSPPPLASTRSASSTTWSGL